MKVKIKDGYLVIRIPLGDLPFGPDSLHAVAPFVPKKPKEYAPLKHSDICLALRKAEVMFARQWPIHCRTCAARGYITRAETGQKQACPRCIEFGLCSRCGNSALGKVSTEDGTYFVCGNDNCGWDQAQALTPAAEAAGLTAPVWRCECEKENADA